MTNQRSQKVQYAEEKPDGMYSNLTYLPCKIHLPLNKKYAFYIEGKRFQVYLLEKRRSLTIISSDDEIVKTEASYSVPNVAIPKQLSVIKDPATGDDSIYLGDRGGDMMLHTPFTLLVVEFEGIDLTNNCKLARTALNYFLNSYQYTSMDTLAFTPAEMVINSFVDYDFFYRYQDKEATMSENERFNLSYTRNYSPNNTDIKAYHKTFSGGMDKRVEEFDAKITALLSAQYKNEFIISTMYKAETQIYPQRNYKYALLDYFFVIEAVIANFVTERKQALGISKSKLDDYKTQVTISYMINVDIPLLNQPLTDELKELLKQVDEIRKIRNDVVHKQTSVNEEQARKAKTATYKLIDFLKISVAQTTLPVDIATKLAQYPGLSLGE